MLRCDASYKRIQLEYTLVPTLKDKYVWIDEVRIQQVLINLIQNAIKFSYRNHKVNIVIEMN